MRKKLWKTAAVIMAASAMLLTACGGTGDNTSSENTEAQEGNSSNAASGESESGEDLSLQKVKDAGKFVLGLDATFKPMGYTDENNEIVGFDID